MPDPMHYTTQTVICLDNDLLRVAKATQAKRRLAGDAHGIVNGAAVDRSLLFIPGSPINLPTTYRLSNSRMIIIGHGNPESTHISSSTQAVAGGDYWWTPSQLADKVMAWLSGNVIKTISLIMCYGGGNKGTATKFSSDTANTFVNKFAVKPQQSFAYEFASRCPNAERITARTGKVTVITEFFGSGDATAPDFGDRVAGVTSKVSGVRRGKGYKVIFTPNGLARPNNPKAPGMSILNA